MYFTSFLQQIVIPHRIDIVGWPLKKMIDPSQMSIHDLQAVHRGLTSTPPSIYFRELTDAELVEKREALEELKKQEVSEKAKLKKRKHQGNSSSDPNGIEDEKSDSEDTSTNVRKKRRNHHSTSTLDDTDSD